MPPLSGADGIASRPFLIFFGPGYLQMQTAP